MELKVNEIATRYLCGLRRVSSVAEGLLLSEEVLLLPENADIVVWENGQVKVSGFGNLIDVENTDLLRIIRVLESGKMEYEETNILAPATYLHSLKEIPWHISTQGVLFTRISSEVRRFIAEEQEKLKDYYGKHLMDRIWLPCSKPLALVDETDLSCIFNRRTGGWDGTKEHPAIDLLGAGGHLQTIWDGENGEFSPRDFSENLIKEIAEEIGLKVSTKDTTCIGRFLNRESRELVILSGVLIDGDKIPDIQRHALGNFAENTDGIYLGTFKETMMYYRRKPSFFAGGVRAAKTNFPNNRFIVESIERLFGVKM